MLRKICFMLALAALLTAALLKNTDTAKASPDMQTITLNTGYNHSSQQAYGIGVGDAFWTLVKDASGPTSRPAITINKHSAWSPPGGASQWISFSQNGVGRAGGIYVYQKCFCLTKTLWENPEAMRQSSLDITVRADDGFYLGLNTVPGPGNSLLATIPGSSGGFSGAPGTLSVKGEKLLSLLKPGTNCLYARVDDTGGVITGLNVSGTLTAAGIDGIASVSAPGAPPQYAGCSACARTRPDRSTEAQGEVKSIDGLLAPGRPEK